MWLRSVLVFHRVIQMIEFLTWKLIIVAIAAFIYGLCGGFTEHSEQQGPPGERDFSEH